MAVLLVATCAAGISHFQVMTDPQELWVGPRSQAAQEKAAYEARSGQAVEVAAATDLPAALHA